MKENTNRVMQYGLSMYGGWYADIVVDGKVKHLHEERLKDITQLCYTYGITITSWKNIPRFDN